MFLRYFCKVTAEPADLGFRYFKELYELDISMRVLPTNVADFTGGLEQWAPYTEEFVRPVPNWFINIICGEGDDIVRLFTAGVPNVAITHASNEDRVLRALFDYNVVICPTDEDVKQLRSFFIAANAAPPDTDTVAPLIEGLL